MGRSPDVDVRSEELCQSAMKIIAAIERNMENPYSSEGFYKIFAAGFLPVPYLWKELEEFKYAKNWRTKPVRGGVRVMNESNTVMTTQRRIDMALSHLSDAEYNLRQRQR